MTHEDPSKRLSYAEFAKLIGYSRATVFRWEKKGIIKARRLPGTKPFFLEEDVSAFKSLPQGGVR
jgi:predicted site-specific integrase-resolvase